MCNDNLYILNEFFTSYLHNPYVYTLGLGKKCEAFQNTKKYTEQITK